MALAAVVFPMPISPVPARSRPAARSASTSAMPASTAASISSRVIAGPRVMLRVPGAIRIDRSAGWAASGPATPRSATTTSRARLAGEHIDRGAAAQEVLDHLRRHDLRVRAHPFGDDAVIGGQREDHRPVAAGAGSGP